MQDKALIRRLKAQDENALKELIAGYSAYVTTIIRNVGRTAFAESDVEELAADVFIAVCEHAEDLHGDSLKNYLGVTARHKAINLLRDSVHIQMKEMDADALKTALISGDVPDIICTGHIPYESFVKKGLFEDLSQYMTSDADFHKEDYLPNFLDVLQYNGGLYSLSYAYTVYTVSGKTKTVGRKEGLSLAEYMALVQSLPEGMDFTFHPTNWSVFGEYCLGTMCSFVDVPNAACHFDSPEMVQFLRVCGAFPSDRTVYPEYDDPSELLHADKIAVQSEHPVTAQGRGMGFFFCFRRSTRIV